MNNILILGTGAWATALGNVLLENHHSVSFYGIDEKEINDLKTGYNKKYYGDEKLYCNPKVASNNLEEIFKNYSYDLIVIAVPSFAISNVLKEILKYITNKPIFVNVAKGLNPATNLPWSNEIKKITKSKTKGLVNLVGPSFAVEVFKKHPTMINGVGYKKTLTRMVCKIFSNHYFKCIAIKDEGGAEIVSSLKNVMAIACGMTYEMHTSINTRAAMLAQATKEISLIMKSTSGKNETILELCGIGDIFLTCSDSKSRNFSFGVEIAKHGAKDAVKNNNSTVEGYKSLEVAYNIVKENSLPCPVIDELYQTVYHNKNPKNFILNIVKKIKH